MVPAFVDPFDHEFLLPSLGNSSVAFEDDTIRTQTFVVQDFVVSQTGFYHVSQNMAILKQAHKKTKQKNKNNMNKRLSNIENPKTITDEENIAVSPNVQRRSSIASAARRTSEELYIKVDEKLNAYERERVPENRLKGWLSFLGLFASRHTAGTEFAIGPLFVARGSSAIDIILGLLIGNILATLSWRYIVAPLAVSQRLTTYYAMERVVGRRLLLVFDILSCVLLAGLAGAM